MTITVGIIGYPLGHSISPAFQQAAFDFYGLDMRYVAWETPPESIAQRVEALRSDDILGANVTVPHKEAVQPYLDRLSDLAERTGAVNTIVNRSGVLEGHNTDVTGFMRALREDGDFDPKGKRVLLMGAGGVAKAAANALMDAGVVSLTIANRMVELDMAQRLVAALGGGTALEAIPLEREALVVRNGWDLIVNCTILGMWHGPGEDESPLPGDLIPPNALVYDVVYNPENTPLLRAAARAGASTLSGLSMLVYQGAESFRLWTERDAPMKVMFDAARRALDEMTSGR